MTSDPAVEKVFAWLSNHERLRLACAASRMAIDFLLDGARTGHYEIEQLSKNEKTHIGTMFELFLLKYLDLEKDESPTGLDTIIDGIRVDIKFTIGDNWMIPIEAVDEVVVLAQADDATSDFKIGVIRAADSVLNAGGNRDKKRSFSSAGRRAIHWLDAPKMAPNQLLHLSKDDRNYIFAGAHGQGRIVRLCEKIVAVPIRRYTFETVAQQIDPGRRIRGARKTLKDRFRVLSGKYDRRAAKDAGFDLNNNEWMLLPK
jgi:hypothetical protein